MRNPLTSLPALIAGLARLATTLAHRITGPALILTGLALIVTWTWTTTPYGLPTAGAALILVDFLRD